jgi:hypothetical protein
MKTRLLNVLDLTHADIDAMYALLDRYFSGVSYEVFTSDLYQKNWALLIDDPDTDQLQGFTTLLIRQTEFLGELINVVYSGDTIVDPSAWGSSALPKAWVAAINQLRQTYSQGRFYWLLICSGYRTYRFLPVFAKTFYPCHDRPTPPDVQAMINFLARSQYQDLYHADTGIIQLLHPQQLRPGLDGIPTGRLGDPHIDFFNRINPQHDAGDELVCFAEVCESNLTAAGRRIWTTSSQTTSSKILAGV